MDSSERCTTLRIYSMLAELRTSKMVIMVTFMLFIFKKQLKKVCFVPNNNILETVNALNLC